MEIEDVSFPLKHPLFRVRNAKADLHTAKIMFYRPLWKRIAVNIKKYFVTKNE
jgi:hypothetical protein